MQRDDELRLWNRAHRASAHWHKSSPKQRDDELRLWNGMDPAERRLQIRKQEREARREDRDQLLLSAARDGDLALATRLLDGDREHGGRGKVSASCRSPHTDSVGLPGTHSTPLHAAVLAGKLDAVRLLLERGASPEARDRDNCTALILASSLGSREVVAALLAGGCDPNAPGTFGHTPLHKVQTRTPVNPRLLAPRWDVTRSRNPPPSLSFSHLLVASQSGGVARAHRYCPRAHRRRGQRAFSRHER